MLESAVKNIKRLVVVVGVYRALWVIPELQLGSITAGNGLSEEPQERWSIPIGRQVCSIWLLNTWMRGATELKYRKALRGVVVVSVRQNLSRPRILL